MNKKLTVFISSKFTDLKPERQAAVEAVLKAGHIPAGMELFKSGDASQLETIYKWIDDCDVYVLILGGRYGSIEPKSGLSYIELEYNYAQSKGKYCFSIVIEESALDQKAKSYGLEVLERDNQSKLSEFRKKVLSKISAFFSDEKDIKLAIMESMGNLQDLPDMIGWVKANALSSYDQAIENNQKLIAENELLRGRLAAAESKIGSRPGDEVDLEKLIEVFSSQNVSIPSEIAKSEEPFEANLLNVIWAIRETLALGITSSVQTNKHDIWAYYNIFPKLLIHGLSQNEKLPGVQFRRSFMTEKGLNFLKFLEMKHFDGILFKDNAEAAR